MAEEDVVVVVVDLTVLLTTWPVSMRFPGIRNRPPASTHQMWKIHVKSTNVSTHATRVHIPMDVSTLHTPNTTSMRSPTSGRTCGKKPNPPYGSTTVVFCTRAA